MIIKTDHDTSFHASDALCGDVPIKLIVTDAFLIADTAEVRKLMAACENHLEYLSDAMIDSENGITIKDRNDASEKEQDTIEDTAFNAREFVSGFVYLMRDTKNNAVKIGWSKNPKYRENTLQSEKPFIELFAMFDGTQDDEARLHACFSNKRIRGEWFALTEKDIEMVKFIV